jgi:glycosyltransferase involved in cell wall biosynthesis
VTSLSIVVPVHAVESYLLPCLDSLRAGLTPEESAAVEIIAVDDASPDGCGALLDAYAVTRAMISHLLVVAGNDGRMHPSAARRDTQRPLAVSSGAVSTPRLAQPASIR